MADKLIYFSNDETQINPSVDYLQSLVENLNTQLNSQLTTIQKKKSPKLLSQRIRERYYKTLGISV